MTALGLDFGTKRIGLAITRASLVEPLVVVENDREVFAKIARICEGEQVERIVVGISEGKMAEKTQEFAERLKKRVDLPIEFFDETLSSQEARERIKTKKQSQRSQPVDHYAAAQFLEEWMEYRSDN